MKGCEAPHVFTLSFREARERRYTMGLDTQCMRARREGEAHQLVGFRDGSRKGHCLNLKGVRFRGLSILVLASQGMLHRLARYSTRVVHVLGQRGVPPPCLFRRSLSVQAAH